MRFGSHLIHSSTGVQQGDPLGPLAFAAAVHPFASKVAAGPLDLAFFYLDDGVLAGRIGDVAVALRSIMQSAGAAGLEVNLKKCELVVPGSLRQVDLEANFPQPLMFDDSGQSRIRQCSLELLGAAIGTRDFCEAHTAARVDGARQLLGEISDLQDPQVALRLLRSCAGYSKIGFSTRCATRVTV